MRRALAASAAAHVLLAGVWLASFRPSTPDGPPADAVAQMIFVDPGDGQSDAPAAAAYAASPPAPDTEPAAPPPTEPASALAPAVSGADRDAGSTSLLADSDIPVGPDPSAPNIPPRYPSVAVRRGQQGVVVLAVAVTPDGDASGVDVYVSSGYGVLDRAARDAVALWRFTPRTDGGPPRPAHTLIRVRFRLD